MNPRNQVERFSTEAAKGAVSELHVRGLIAVVSLGAGKILHVYVSSEVAALVCSGAVLGTGTVIRCAIRRRPHPDNPVKIVSSTRF